MTANNGQVLVSISPTGEVTVEAQGVKGAGCHALTKAIEQSLGVVAADNLKPEYNQRPQLGQQNTVRQ